MLPLLNADGAAVPETDLPPLGPNGPKGKVELDLEGAPFLEPDPAPSPVKTSQATQEEPEPSPAPKSRKKLILLIAAPLVLLLVGGGIAAYFLLFRSTSPKIQAPPGVEVIVIPSTPPELPAAPVSAYKIEWAPFWVEIQDPEGEIRFIYCQFTLNTNNSRIAMQLRAKDLTLRDAVYYFLRHKPYGELADPRRLGTLKTEVLNIINYYILPEQVTPATPNSSEPPRYERLQDILIEDYLIK